MFKTPLLNIYLYIVTVIRYTCILNGMGVIIILG